MSDLREYLKRNIESHLRLKKKQAQQTERALEMMEHVDLDNAKYRVRIQCHYPNKKLKFLQPVDIVHEGTIEGAIIRAEQEYRAVNNVEKIHYADYDVKIILGEASFLVPDEYWKPYREKE